MGHSDTFETAVLNPAQSRVDVERKGSSQKKASNDPDSPPELAAEGSKIIGRHVQSLDGGSIYVRQT